MNRRSGVVVGVAGIALIAVWWLRRGGDPAPTAQSVADRRTGAGAIRSGPSVDPRTQPRGSISGSITDGAAPVTGASVCASASGEQLPGAVTQSPACAASDDRGRYKIANLLAADYTVVAGAPQFLPGAFHPRPHAPNLTFALAAGETRTGVDVALTRGGVEVTGIVRDISGGAIAHAQVRASSRALRQQGPVFEADEQGRFSAWVDRGFVSLEARADGYASSRAYGSAPGTFEIALTPASTLAGRVIDAATEQPVPGARVELENTSFDGSGRASDITDAQGAFRIDRLTPGRFTAVATAERGYGRSEGSTLVGLGQSVDGVVVKLYPAHRIAGRIVIGADQRACTDGGISLNEVGRGRWLGARAERDGSLVIRGVLSGTYRVSVTCQGYTSRDDEPIAVRDGDVTGRVWRLDEGARIRGKIVTRSGAVVAEAQLIAQNVGGAARDSAGRAAARSQPDGRYELTGLKPGAYRIEVTSDRGVSPREGYTVSVPASATVEQDLALEDGGKVTGSVVDADGKPVPAIRVDANVGDGPGGRDGSEVTTDARGAFTFEALRPDAYRVRARRSGDFPWPRPGSDGKFDGATVTVRAGETATVKLLVESQNGIITGTVVDASGAPVADAFVSSARDFGPEIRGTSSVARTRHAAWGEGALVLTSSDGRFTLDHLAAGTHAVVAHRKGGGEAYAEHVALGAAVKLQIRPTGSIAGIVRSNGSPLQDLRIGVHDENTGFHRSEIFYRTDGRFKLDDLPAGHFDIVASGDGGQKVTTADLAEGEMKTGIELSLETLVTVTGRLVDPSQKPIPGYRMFIDSKDAARSSMSVNPDMGPESITDESGKFKVSRIRLGQVTITGLPAGGSSGGDTEFVHTVRVIAGSGTVDLGEVRVLRPRIKRGEPRGKLGIRFVEQPEDTTPDKTELKIETIDPGGPAAKTALRTGDVITSFDGIDVTGAHSSDFWTLMQAPPGTKVTIGTQRGVTVTATLAAP